MHALYTIMLTMKLIVSLMLQILSKQINYMIMLSKQTLIIISHKNTTLHID